MKGGVQSSQKGNIKLNPQYKNTEVYSCPVPRRTVSADHYVFKIVVS